eukprot:symbB.v1.2.037330.t1/scaffold5207.1/size83351/6
MLTTAPLDCTTPHSKGSTWSDFPKHGKASVTELQVRSLMNILGHAPLDCTTPHSKGSIWSGLPKHGKVAVDPSFIELKLKRLHALHTTPSTMLTTVRVEACGTKLDDRSLIANIQAVFAPLDCTTPLYQPCLVSLPLPFHVSGGSTWRGLPKLGKVTVDPGFIELKLTRLHALCFPINVVVRRSHTPKQVFKAKTFASVMRAVRVEALHASASTMLTTVEACSSAPLHCTTPHSKGSTWSEVAVDPSFLELKLKRLHALCFPINVVVRRWYMPKQVCKALQAKTSASVMRAVKVEALHTTPSTMLTTVRVEGLPSGRDKMLSFSLEFLAG